MKYDFLILGFGEVSSSWTNPQWMAYTLSKEKNSVAYFNPPAYKKVRLGHIQRLFQRLFQTNKKKYSEFKIYNSYLNNHPFFRLINYFELNKINKIISQSKNIVCFQPLWLEFLNIPNDKTTFIICDDYSSLNSSGLNQKKLDKYVTENYDNIIITHKSLNSKFPKAIFETNCISRFHFNYSSQKILDKKKKNQACFVGALHYQKIDLDIIIKVLNNNPDIDFLFAGKQHGISIEKLSNFDNFKYLGELNFEDAIQLMRESKYGLIPFSNNNYTASVSSMKYFEYIASLTIPVCTDIPMYNFLPKDLRPTLFLDDEVNLKKFSYSNLSEMRKYILNNYTYSSRINRLRKIGYFKS
tara:strand:+ start:854 stop:1918 length:1065 start_codon:yes stop_codon:yes gene_type:complete